MPAVERIRSIKNARSRDRSPREKTLFVFTEKPERAGCHLRLHRIVENHLVAALRGTHKPRTAGNITVNHPLRIKTGDGVGISRYLRMRIRPFNVRNLRPGGIEHLESKSPPQLVCRCLRNKTSSGLRPNEPGIFRHHKIAARRRKRDIKSAQFEIGPPERRIVQCYLFGTERFYKIENLLVERRQSRMAEFLPPDHERIVQFLPVWIRWQHGRNAHMPKIIQPAGFARIGDV